MKKLLFASLLCVGLLPSASFAQKAQTNKVKSAANKPQHIVGVWELTYLEGVDVSVLYKNSKPRVSFDPKRILISGNNSCNSFSCPIKIEGFKIIYTKQMMQTLKACPGNGEQKFMDALVTVSSFAFSENDKLDLIAGDRGVMQFKRIIKKKK